MTRIYGAYFWTVFFLLGLLTVFAMLLPGVRLRRRIAHGTSRAIFALAGMPVTVKSAGNIPPGQCVIVANHASYLDGPLMTAVLPPRFAFVIKREMSRVPLAGLLLKRLGSQFVERFDRQRSAADARRMLREAVNGHSLVFFPEGTYSLTPGLLKFHTGAFVTASRAGCAVVPTVIRGSRCALPPKSRAPHRARIEVEFLSPVSPSAAAENPALDLRDRARAAIAAALGEPDLAL